MKAYDEVVNLAQVTRDGVTSAYAYDANHPHAVGTVTGGQLRGFTYDANGSMVQRVIGADTFTLLYDGSLRMVAVQKNGATIAEFAYDGDGRMTVSAVGGVTTYTVGGYFEWRVDASGSRVVKYYSAGSARVAMRKEGVVTYLFGDHLGSTSVAFDDAANAAQSQGYTAFGEQRYFVSENALPFSTDYQYTGQKEFAEIGLHFYNARWYDSVLGRFTQADSIIPQPGNPADWDRYSYVLNRPVNASDPSGHCYKMVNGELAPECQKRWQEYDAAIKKPTVSLPATNTSNLQDSSNTCPLVSPERQTVTISPPEQSDELEFTPFWETELLNGNGLHIDGGIIVVVLGINISVDVVYNETSNESAVILTPAVLIGIGEGASASGGYTAFYNAPSNSDLQGGVIGFQGTIIPALGVSGSYTRSFGTGRVPEIWSGNVGVVEEISAVAFVGYSIVFPLNDK